MKKLSIKKKIMIWFAAALLVLVLATSAFTLYISKDVLNQTAQERLMNIVNSNAEKIEFYNNLQDKEQEPSDLFLSYKGGILEIDGDFCNYYDGVCTSLVDSDNALIYGEMPFVLPEDEIFSFTSVGMTTYKGEKYYIYEKKLSGDNLDGLWLRGFISENESNHILYTVARMFLLIVPFFAVAALVGGYAITRRSFLPIEKISNAVTEISDSGDLSRRIDLVSGNDELHQLANKFDAMFERLENNFNAERQFTSDASHEMRTPISVIQAQCEYALDFADSDEEYKEALEVIKRQSKALASLLSQLLFFTRLEQGTENYQRSSLNLSDLINTVCDDRRILLTPAQSLDTDVEENVFIDGNSDLLYRLLSNLLDNAYKYSGEEACVIVTLKAQNGVAKLSVSDNGIGISPENLDKIWNRFYREDSSRSSDESFGLGLAMVKQISDFHGATVEAHSEQGRGNTFTFSVPFSLRQQK